MKIKLDVKKGISYLLSCETMEKGLMEIAEKVVKRANQQGGRFRAVKRGRKRARVLIVDAEVSETDEKIDELEQSKLIMKMLFKKE